MGENKPKFTRTNRNGKVALRVEFDERGRFIAEVPNKDLTNEVQQAIISAFYCGLEAQHDFIVKQCRNTRSINDQKQFEIEI
jgi:hypothetical protein